MTNQYKICKLTLADSHNILDLYNKVAEVSGGIIRIPEEIDFNYVSSFIKQSLETGLILGIKDKHSTIAEIHAYQIPLSVFRHILTDLTIVVDPDYQGQKLGRKLFSRFLEIIEREYHHILRVELFVRETNKIAIQFYKSLGFNDEGRQLSKIKNSNNSLETPIHMAWFNPKYNN